MSGRNKVKIYSIIHTNHGKQKEVLCSEKTEKAIYKRFNEILRENRDVVKFPMRYNNLQHVMVESEHEIYIIKCKDEMIDKDVNKIRDDSGKYVNYETDNEDWIVVDRAAYEVEETFWVYGYHPRLQRKTFQWVFDEFIAKDGKDKYKFKTVALYNNKILFECNDELNMVTCKNKSDAIRFYNQLEEWSIQKKLHKFIFFIGDIKKSRFKLDWMEKIQKLTNWNMRKIKRLSTRD